MLINFLGPASEGMKYTAGVRSASEGTNTITGGEPSRRGDGMAHADSGAQGVFFSLSARVSRLRVNFDGVWNSWGTRTYDHRFQ